MVAEGILSPFSVGCSLFILSNVFLSFYQLFPFSSICCFSLLRHVLLFSFHWICLFSCCRRLCVLSFYRPLLIPCAHLDASTISDFRLLPISYVDLHFLHAQSMILLLRSGLIYCVRKLKRRNPVSFTPNPVNRNYLLHPCEG